MKAGSLPRVPRFSQRFCAVLRPAGMRGIMRGMTSEQSPQRRPFRAASQAGLAWICLWVWGGPALAELALHPPDVPAHFPQMVSVPAGAFEMGRRDEGDDTHGAGDELPRHRVWLDAYRIGRYEVTNAEYAAVLDWALKEGRIDPFTDGDLHVNGRPILRVTSRYCQVVCVEGAFLIKNIGAHPMDRHPVVMVTWYGAVAFCNWLSEMRGLPRCYDLDTWEPRLPWADGYRLPTEAEWERAAAWDPDATPSHRVYAFPHDRIDLSWCNHRYSVDAVWANPLGLVDAPRTSPVGFYDGEHFNDAPSPVGCYDMSGNVWEWCHDRYAADYYARTPAVDPRGPKTGERRVERGGGWNGSELYCRTAKRNFDAPDFAFFDLGFRVTRSGAS